MIQSDQLTEDELKRFKPGICNRLDRNTSGLVVAGKSLVGLQQMGELFKQRSLKKYYRCLVEGKVLEGKYVKGYLTKDQRTNKVCIIASEIEGSLPIETEYRPIAYTDSCTLLEVHLITGRTHQIRAHLASEGHPIIGDYKYGITTLNDKYKKQYGLQSQLLHAYRLEMPELTGELKSLSAKMFTAELPELFARILKEEHIKG